MKRKITYNAGMYRTSLPKKIVEMLGLKDGDYIQYLIHDDGTITIKKAEKENGNE